VINVTKNLHKNRFDNSFKNSHWREAIQVHCVPKFLYSIVISSLSHHLKSIWEKTVRNPRKGLLNGTVIHADIVGSRLMKLEKHSNSLLIEHNLHQYFGLGCVPFNCSLSPGWSIRATLTHPMPWQSPFSCQDVIVDTSISMYVRAQCIPKPQYPL